MDSSLTLPRIAFGVIGDARGRQRRRHRWTLTAVTVAAFAAAGSFAAAGGAFDGGHARLPARLAADTHRGPTAAVRCRAPAPFSRRHARLRGRVVYLIVDCSAHRVVIRS
ncbi:MAG: hypothetical protein ACRDLP_14770 [Solirubrobacteraceae bacterium]